MVQLSKSALAPRTGRKPRILIVDDSPTVLAQTLAHLTDDYDCLSAGDGKEALETALREGPAAMLIDLEMPRMDGSALLRALKADPRTRNIPVVVVTTVVAVDRMNECRALGCAGFVLKPVEPSYLRIKLRQLVSAAGAVSR